MERERPDYLEPIPRKRWEFPWLGMWAVLLLGMTGAGVWLHLKTTDAWSTRFSSPPASPAATAPVESRAIEIDPIREANIAEIRIRREKAEREARQQRDELRCINGVAFRRIPGGWENVPNVPCP